MKESKNGPKIVCFLCKWCSYAGADLAGTTRLEYLPNGIIIGVNCSSRIDPEHILWAFNNGADGVLVAGCHFGDCHYRTGNYKTFRRIVLLKKLMNAAGIEEKRLRLEWISASESQKFADTINGFVKELKELGG
ncbi:MAG: hydrogenase iron-sulfur subunit [Elusimicrobiota bacterium]